MPLTEDALAAVWAMYERALGPVGGRNSERAALYAQEKQLWLVRDQEAQAAEELARLAAERDGLETDLGSGEDLARRQELDTDVARIHEARAACPAPTAYSHDDGQDVPPWGRPH